MVELDDAGVFATTTLMTRRMEQRGQPCSDCSSFGEGAFPCPCRRPREGEEGAKEGCSKATLRRPKLTPFVPFCFFPLRSSSVRPTARSR